MKLLKSITIVTAAIPVFAGLGVLLQEYPAVFLVGFCVSLFAAFVGFVYSLLD